MRAWALPFVRPVVPKPGSVSAWILSCGTPSRSNVFATTSRASVESSPPDTPMATAGLPMWSSRFASPATCVAKISSHRSVSVVGSDGTNGCGSTRRSSLPTISARSSWNATRRKSRSNPGAWRTSLKLFPCVRSRCKPIQVDVGNREVSVPPEPPGLGQDAAVLGDEAVPAEHDVGRRFARPARRIDVPAEAPAGRIRHKLSAVRRLANGLVAGAQVGEHRRPGHRLQRARRDRPPQVFADLDAEHEPGELRRRAFKEQVRPERHRLPGHGHALRTPRCRPGRSTARRRTPCNSAGTSSG